MGLRVTNLQEAKPRHTSFIKAVNTREAKKASRRNCASVPVSSLLQLASAIAAYSRLHSRVSSTRVALNLSLVPRPLYVTDPWRK